MTTADAVSVRPASSDVVSQARMITEGLDLNGLEAIVDQRGEELLRVTFDGQGLVAWVDVRTAGLAGWLKRAGRTGGRVSSYDETAGLILDYTGKPLDWVLGRLSKRVQGAFSGCCVRLLPAGSN